MALNPNIILQGKTPTFEAPDPIAQYSKGLQLKGLMTQQNLQDQQMADDQATRAAYQSGDGDPKAVLKTLLSGGNYKAAQALQKQLDDQAKTQAETSYKTAQTGQANASTQKTQQDIKFEAAANHAKNLNLIQTPQDAVKYVDDGISSGVFPAEGREAMLQNISAAPSLSGWVAQQKLAAIPVLEKFKQDAENSRNAATNLTSRQNNANNNATTMRGQNMTDARTRESNAQSFSKPFEVTGPDGKPILVRQDKSGNVTPVEGFGPKAGAPKSLTETQGKATGFAARMQDASKIIEPLEGKVNPLSVAAANQDGITGAISNYAAGKLDPQSQLYQQAQENWVTANLRLESGAAIGKEEKAQEIRKWFPQPGDTPAKIQQKANARKVAERAMVAQTGPGASQINGIVNGDNAPAAPKTFDSLPDPASLKGRLIQAPDGSKMRSNGSKWIQEK